MFIFDNEISLLRKCLKKSNHKHPFFNKWQKQKSNDIPFFDRWKKRKLHHNSFLCRGENENRTIRMLILDGILFEYIYSDLMMLAKLVLDMNIHYLELKIFLEELVNDASVILKADPSPFASESRLYGTKRMPHCPHIEW